MIVGSFSLLNQFERCARQAYEERIAKKIPFVETEASKWGNRVHSALESALRDGTGLPEGMRQFGGFLPALGGSLPEVKLGVRADWSACGFFDKSVWFRGKADVIKFSEDGRSVALPDWKTGKKREDPDELECMAALVKAHYPKVENFVGWYVWLKDLELGRMHNLNPVADKQAEITGRMERLHQAERMNHWPETENALCGWCSIRQCRFWKERR